MASVLDTLGISKEVIAQVEPEEVYEGSTLPAGLYKVVVDKAYIRKTDSGANMLEVDFKMEDGTDFHYSTCVLSGDEKGNKSTYTSKQGKEVALPGVVSLTKFLTAIDSVKANAIEGEVDHRGKGNIKALCFDGLQGKALLVGVNQEESFYQGDVLIKNDVKYWLDESGKNSAGEDLKEKVEESLEKHPLKKLKQAGGNTPSAGAGAGAGKSASSESGW